METGLGELLKKGEADRAIFQMWLKGAMSDTRNVAHDKKVIHEKQKHEEEPLMSQIRKEQPFCIIEWYFVIN
jgi:hypothetical protein